jgi:hypothetical protein
VKRVCLAARFRPSSEPIAGRMCYIEPDLAGFPFRHIFNGLEVELRFPRITYPLPAPGYFNAAPHDDKDYIPDQLMPAYFDAQVLFEVGDDAQSSDYRDSFQLAMDSLRIAATRLSDSLRTIQPSVGHPGDSPQALQCVAIDFETNEKIVIPVPIGKAIGMVVGYPALSVRRAREVLRDGPDATSSLLAQARYLVIAVRDPQPGLAVLLAAVACEAHAKEVLLNRADAMTKPLLDVFLRRARIFQEPALQLFGEVARAVLGRSLRDDNQKLWKQLDQLFQARNKMAHVADRPSLDTARELVFAAKQAIEWLDSGQARKCPETP